MVICVLVFTVFCIVCTVFLHCFLYVYLSFFVLSVLVKGPLPSSDNSIAVSSNNTYLLTPWSRVLLEKLTGSAVSQEIPLFFETRKFITATYSEPTLSSPHNPLPLPEYTVELKINKDIYTAEYLKLAGIYP